MADEAVALPLPISYAPLLPWHRRRRTRRIIYLLVVIGVVAVGYRFGSRVWHQIVATYTIRACLGYTNPPPTTVVFDTIKRSGTVPATWARLQPIITPITGLPDAIVFMHRMRSPAGSERLVVVSIVMTSRISTSVFDTGSWHILPRRLSVAVSNGINVTQSGRRSTQIFAGQPDPKDATHFAFRVDLATGEVLIFDGRLRDNDTVDLREQSLNPPSPFRLAPTRRAKPENL